MSSRRNKRSGRFAVVRSAAVAVPLGLICVALAGVAIAALAFRLPAERDGGGPLEVSLAANASRGELELANSHRGHAILFGRRMAPGDRVRGSVWVRNRSQRPVRLMLSKSGLRSPVGASGARLAPSLRLRVRRMRPHGRRVYSGPLRELRGSRAGRLRPGVARRYRFVVKLRDGGLPADPASGDNRLQETRARVGFVWTARPARRR